MGLLGSYGSMSALPTTTSQCAELRLSRSDLSGRPTAQRLEEQGEGIGQRRAAYHPDLRNKQVGLDAAEKSMQKRLATIREQKAKYKTASMPKSPDKTEGHLSHSPTTQVIHVDEMNVTPGRKARKPGLPAEEMEYQVRELLGVLFRGHLYPRTSERRNL